MPFRRAPELRDLKDELDQRLRIVWEQATLLLALRRTEVASRYPAEVEAMFSEQPAQMLVEWIADVEKRTHSSGVEEAVSSLIPSLEFHDVPEAVRVYLWVWLRAEKPKNQHDRVELFQGAVDLPALPTLGSKLSFRWPGSNFNVWGDVTDISLYLELHGDDFVPWDRHPHPDVTVVVREKSDIPWPSLRRAEVLERLRAERARGEVEEGPEI